MTATPLIKSLTFLVEAISATKVNRKLAPHRKAIERETARLFRKQGLAFGRAVTQLATLQEADSVDAKALGGIFDSTMGVDYAALAKAILSCYITGMATANAEYALSMRFDLKNPRAVAYARTRGAELLAELNQTTKNDINELIINGLEHGLSPAVIARSIKSLFVSYGSTKRGKQSRAEKVARTETAKAYSAGNYGAILDATGTGLEFEKRWLTVGDDRVDSPCPDNASDSWIPMEQPHSSGVMYPPAHPNCRCVEMYRRIGSK